MKWLPVNHADILLCSMMFKSKKLTPFAHSIIQISDIKNAGLRGLFYKPQVRLL